MIRSSLLQHGSVPVRYLSQVRCISSTVIVTARNFVPDKPKSNKFRNDRSYNKFTSKSSASKYLDKFVANPHRQRDGKHAKPIPTPEELSKSNQSKIQTKLQYFVDTGVIVKSPKKQFTKSFSKINSKYGSPQSGPYDLKKGLRTLKERYDTAEFIDKEGNVFPISNLHEYDLKYDSNKARIIFDNLINIKKITKSSIDKNLMLCLLGTNGEQLSDGYFLTKNILELLTIDNDIERGLHLVRMAKDKSCASVGMNVLMKWVLDKGDVEEGIKMFHERNKTGIPVNNHTLVILFDGIAKASGWGQVSDSLADRMSELFKNNREKTGGTIEEFNACLSILIKNFHNQQSKAWDFFTELLPDYDKELQEILPNDITFTIMINGLKRCMNYNKDLIKQDRDMNHYERILRLLETESNCIQMVDAAFEKIKSLAIKNPDKINMGIQLIVTYLSCYVDKFGSPYRYNEKALYLASQYSPAVREMFEYVQTASKVPDITRVDKSLMKKQDSSLQRAIENSPKDIEFSYYDAINEFLPKVIVPDLKPENANPKVNKQISTSKKRGRLELISRERPLIDLSLETSKGKTVYKKYAINKFLLNLIFDGLVNIGRFPEFIFALWFSLIRWNGVQLELGEIAKNKHPLNGVIPFDELPRSTDKACEVTSKSHANDLYDDIMLKNIFLRIGETKGKGSTNTHLIIELFNVLSSPKYNPTGIAPTYDHVKLMFYILKEDLKYYKAVNINNDRTRGFLINQLQEFTTNLYNFNEGYMLLNQRNKRSTHHWIIDELNEIYNTLYTNHWNQFTSEQELIIHKILIKSYILYYPEFNLKLDSVRRTITLLKEKEVEEKYSKEKDSKDDKELLKRLKDLTNIRKNDDDKELMNKVSKLCREIYNLIIVTPVKVAEEVNTAIVQNESNVTEQEETDAVVKNDSKTIEEINPEAIESTESATPELQSNKE